MLVGALVALVASLAAFFLAILLFSQLREAQGETQEAQEQQTPKPMPQGAQTQLENAQNRLRLAQEQLQRAQQQTPQSGLLEGAQSELGKAKVELEGVQNQLEGAYGEDAGAAAGAGGLESQPEPGSGSIDAEEVQ